MHPDLDFKFWRHHELVRFYRVEYCRFVWVLSLVHLASHAHWLLLSHVRVHAHSIGTDLHRLSHLLIHHLLLAIHVMGYALIFLVLLLLIHVLHLVCRLHVLRGHLLRLLRCWLAGVGLSTVCRHHVCLVVLRHFILLSVSHI